MSKQILLPLLDALIVRYGQISRIFRRLEHTAGENPARPNVTVWGGRRQLNEERCKAQSRVNLFHQYLDNRVKNP